MVCMDDIFGCYATMVTRHRAGSASAFLEPLLVVAKRSTHRGTDDRPTDPERERENARVDHDGDDDTDDAHCGERRKAVHGRDRGTPRDSRLLAAPRVTERLGSARADERIKPPRAHVP